MKTEKMSFRNIKDALSRTEMREIMAGSGGTACVGRCNGGTGMCYRPFDDRIFQCWCTSGGQTSQWACS